MKRTPMPPRRTELRRVTPLRARPQRRARPNEPLAEWCEAAIEGVCTGRAVHRHHRLRKSQGGTDDRSNTLDLDLACHSFIHAHPEWSYQRGFLRRSTGVAS